MKSPAAATQSPPQSTLEAESHAIEAGNAREGGVTARVVALSLGLAAAFGYLIPIVDLQVRNTYLGAGHLPVGAIAVLLLLVLVVNPLLKSLPGGLAFGRNEMLTIYISCLFSALVPGMGSESFFVAHSMGAFYFATRENGWLDVLQPYLKPWFSPALDASSHYGPLQKRAIEAWYTGNGGSDIPWSVWLVPLIAWSAFVFASYIMLGCLSVMLRAQWGEREALAFPMLRLPLQLTEDADHPRLKIGRFFREPRMWLGFALALCIEGLNGLNFYFPDVPHVSLGVATAPLFSEAPWNQMAPTGVMIWPIFAAMTFLLSSEVAFSLWFFLWFVQSQYIVAYYLGFPYGTLPTAIGHSSDGGARTFTAFQQVGAYVAYAAILLWTAREHLRHVTRRAFGRARASEGEAREALSYPAAFWGFIGALGFMIAWSCAAGIRFDVAIALWGLYLVTCLGLSRAVVEGGAMFINQGWVPLSTLAQLMGSGPGHWLSASSIVPASFLQVSFFQDMRGFIMPSFLHGLKLAHDRRLAARRLWWLMIASTLVSLSIGVWMKVRLGYVAGGLALHPWFSIVAPQYPAQVSQEFIRGARDSGSGNWFWMLIGGVFTFGLVVAQGRFSWFTLHPLGYLLALTAPTQRAWFSFFVGWLAKVLLTRFGGHESYRRLIPFALGVIFGEVTMFLGWLGIDAWQGRGGHGLLP